MENYINNINNAIELYCRKTGINTTEFSMQLGYSYAYFSSIKNRGSTFPLSDLGRISDMMGISIHDLIDGRISPSNNDEIEKIPFLSQKLSAGCGEPGIEDLETSIISIPKFIIKNNNPNNIYAAKVKGDSMIGANLFPGDIVCFNKGLVEGDGIYVIYYLNDYYVKRLQFNPFEKKVVVISENPKYKNFEILSDNDNLIIEGKVIGWIHTE